MNQETYIYERDYRTERQKNLTDPEFLENDKIFGILHDTGILKSIAEAFSRLPKEINPEKKKNFDFLLSRLDRFTKENNGMLCGVVSPEDGEARILMELPYLECTGKEQLSLLGELAEKSDYVTISALENGWTHVVVMVKYFKFLVSSKEADGLLEKQFNKHPFLYEELEKWDQLRRKNLYAVFSRLQVLSDILRAAERQGIDPEVVFQRFIDQMEENPEEQEAFLAALCKEFGLAFPPEK